MKISQNAHYSAIVGGHSNCINNACGCSSFVGGGQTNKIFSKFGVIGGGAENQIGFQSGGCSVIVGGCSHCLCAPFAFIGGGQDNCLVKNMMSTSGCHSVIVGGKDNCMEANCSFIGGGCNNKMNNSACCSGILGGKSNCITHDDSFIIGSSITSKANCTAYMNNIAVQCALTVGTTGSLSSTVGRIDATNDVVAFSTSDIRLKENITPIQNPLIKISEISGNTFDWKILDEEGKKNIHGHTGRDIGVIAQEIEQILPEAVTTRDSGYKAVKYEKIIPLLIEAIKDQQKQIDELKSQIYDSPE